MGWLKTFPLAIMVLGACLSVASASSAQSATAVPKLDVDQFVAPWYEIARYPIKKEKACLSDELVLYALGDKKNSFQRATSCKIKGDNSEFWNATGKLDKAGSGRLKIRTIWPFSSKYWILAAGPAYEWMLAGTPNHKSLWILSKTPTMAPEVLAEVEAKAAAQGFDTAKLIKIAQRPQRP